MNKADSLHLADQLERAGYSSTGTVEEADIVVINSCVVRQHAENKVINKLTSLRSLKSRSPGSMIVLTGCMVRNSVDERFPWVDLFLCPQQWEAFDQWLSGLGKVQAGPGTAPDQRYPVSALVPIVHGCDNFCSYCIVPYRRGRVRSRTVEDILGEVTGLVGRGTREVCLLGQIVDQYGYDLPTKMDLADLLTELGGIGGLDRIRFLTSHPAFVSPKLVRAVAKLEKVCEHISLPVQSGDDQILLAMRRGYTAGQYMDLVHTIRQQISQVSISTDVIVGFPGETDDQFSATLSLLKEVRFDKVHVAAYSPRSETLAAKTMIDNVTAQEKQRRLTLLEDLEQEIAGAINASLLGKMVEVLVEGKKKDKWYGRTRTDKLVFFTAEGDRAGQLLNVEIERTSPFALQGSCSG